MPLTAIPMSVQLARALKKKPSSSEDDKVNYHEIYYDKEELAKAQFSMGEKVLCLYNSVIYEAKVLDIVVHPYMQKLHYLLHFKGWSNRTDEYVPQRSLLKYNDENLEFQKKYGVARTKELIEEKTTKIMGKPVQGQAKNNLSRLM